jgi:hypothetical protein
LVNGANPISNRWSFVIIIPIEIALFLEHKPFYGSLTWLRCGHIALRDGPSPRVKRPGPGATGVSEWYKTLIDDVPSSTVFLHMWRVPWRWSPVHDSHSPRFRGPAAMGFHWLSWVITFLWTPGNLVKEPSIWRYGPERISAKSALFCILYLRQGIKPPLPPLFRHILVSPSVCPTVQPLRTLPELVGGSTHLKQPKSIGNDHSESWRKWYLPAAAHTFTVYRKSKLKSCGKDPLFAEYS